MLAAAAMDAISTGFFGAIAAACDEAPRRRDDWRACGVEKNENAAEV
jgi:hypothetical protein